MRKVQVLIRQYEDETPAIYISTKDGDWVGFTLHHALTFGMEDLVEHVDTLPDLISTSAEELEKVEDLYTDRITLTLGGES